MENKMISNKATKILEEIDVFKTFLFSPSRWKEYENAIDELVNLNLIEPLSNFVGTDNNACYVFVKKGNPENIK